MFIGHFGLGYGAKKITSKPSLGTLFMASQFIDLLWPVFLLLGLEQVKIEPGNTPFTPLNFISYPYTHSLFWVLIWAVLFGGIYFLIRKDLKSSILLGLLVISHWILDFLTHRPDLLIFPWNETKVGLGLWYSVPGTIIIESLIFLGGFYFYLKSTTHTNKTGLFATWGLFVFFILIYLTNMTSPPPPSENMIGYAGHAQWLFIIWAYWADKNRKSVSA